MSYAGPLPRLVTPQSIGLYVASRSPVVLDHYRNGVQVERFTDDANFTGANLALAMYTFEGVAVTCRWNRIEYRTAPGGTLLNADDFTTLAAWTAGENGGAFTADSGYAKVTGFIPGTNAAMTWQAMPVGTNYIEIQGLSIEGDTRLGDVDLSSWLGFMAYRDAPAGNSPFILPAGWLLIMRNNGVSELNGGSPVIIESPPLRQSQILANTLRMRQRGF